MKKILLVLTVFVLSISAYSQKLPKVSIFLTDGTSKQYNLADIDKINIIGISGYMMNIYYQHTQTSNFQTKNIDSIRFEKDSKTNDIISIYHAGSPTSFLLSETDSISFYIPSTPVAELTCLNPPQAKIGDVITICGNNFGTTVGNSTIVYTGIISKSFINWSNTQIMATIPEGALTGKVYLTINGIQTNTEDLTIIPHISSLVQTSGGISDTISIIGNGFGLPSKSSFVLFTGIQANSYPFWNDTVINVVVPKGAQSGLISVNASNIKSNEVNFTVIPKIANVIPNSANIGDTVRIYGYNFGTKLDNTHFVSFTSKNADKYINWNDTLITVMVPAGAKTGVVFANIGKTATNNYYFRILPKINSLTPDTVGISEIVTISGVGFGDTQGNSIIYFNSLSIPSLNWSDTLINVIVPDGTQSGIASVKVGLNSSNYIKYSIMQHIISITPDSAKTGDQIVIVGTNFGPQLSSEVIFNDNIHISSVDSWADAQIMLKVPDNAFHGTIKVKVNNKNSNAVPFQVIPHITSISTSSAMLGANITIKGTGFDTTSNGNFVSFNNVNAIQIISWTINSIVIKIPNNASSGKLSVTVDSLQSNLIDFTILPSILSITPGSGTVGDEVTISGASFGNIQGAVSFGGINAYEYLNWGDKQIIVKVPPNAKSGSLIVTTSNLISSNPVSFSVSPIISDINPSSGSMGDIITISGINFGVTRGSNLVIFNKTKADSTDYINWSDSQINVKVPIGATSGKISVTVKKIISNEIDFTYSGPVYAVTIGSQIWMVKNIDVDHYSNGDTIPEFRDETQGAKYAKAGTGAWCYYNYDSSNNATYGKLYNWYAANDPRGLGPSGWHVSTTADWDTLIAFIGTNNNPLAKLKEAGTSHWNSPNEGTTNEYGFTALPAGDITFVNMGLGTFFWTKNGPNGQWEDCFGISNKLCNGCNSWYGKEKYLGQSVRCVKNP